MGFTLHPAQLGLASGTACNSTCSAAHCPVASLPRNTLPLQQQRQRSCQSTHRSHTSAGQAADNDPSSFPHPKQSAATPATATAGVAVTTPAVALDVEYAHYLTAEGKHVSVPAWVAVVDHHYVLLLKTFIQPKARCDGRWIGGVQPSACATAPALPEVLQQLQLLTDGQLLVGHGLAKDLAALGLQHPADLTFDTMMHPAFCNPSGNSKNLQQLARQFLAQAIQQAQQPVQQQQRRRLRGSNSRAKQKERQQQQQQETCVRLLEQAALQHHQQQASRQQVLPQVFSKSGHDPEEDAAAVMQLYQQVVFPSTYEGQVAAATARVLAVMQQQQQAHAANA